MRRIVVALFLSTAFLLSSVVAGYASPPPTPRPGGYPPSPPTGGHTPSSSLLILPAIPLQSTPSTSQTQVADTGTPTWALLLLGLVVLDTGIILILAVRPRLHRR